jgi:hypothetical protein
MNSMKFAYPKEVVSAFVSLEAHNRVVREQMFPGIAGASLPAVVDPGPLTTIVETAYFASIAPEEGRTNPIRVVWSDTVARFAPAQLPPWDFVGFAAPVPFDVSGAVKFASACAGPAGHLVVVGRGQHLEIVGVATPRPRRVHGARRTAPNSRSGAGGDRLGPWRPGGHAISKRQAARAVCFALTEAVVPQVRGVAAALLGEDLIQHARGYIGYFGERVVRKMVENAHGGLLPSCRIGAGGTSDRRCAVAIATDRVWRCSGHCLGVANGGSRTRPTKVRAKDYRWRVG